MTIWIVLVAVGIGSYGLRVSMFVALRARRLPAWTATPMALIAPAAIAALVTATLAVRGGSVTMPATAELFAVAVGMFAVHRSGNVMHAFAAGMPVLWLATALGL